MKGFKVLDAGFFTLVQDKGRFGYADIGVCESGALDEYAYLCVNHLLQNDANTNVLEVALGGLKLEATAPTKIAVCGAEMGFSINGKMMKIWQSFQLEKGDVLSVAFASKGQRLYLGVKGGFELAKHFGSHAVTLKEKFGAKLTKGDFLAYQPFKDTFTTRLQKQFLPIYDEVLTLRLVLGYQETLFSKKEKEKLFSNTYTVSTQCNRMGYRLEGEAVRASKGGIISEAICFGAVQIPSDGQPIVLLKEHQTIGGYPKIGSVLGIDCFALAQRGAKAKVRFQAISCEEAQRLHKTFYYAFL